MWRETGLGLGLTLALAGGALADSCAPHLVSQVDRGLARIGILAEVGALPCSTVTQLFFVLEDDTRGFAGMRPARFRQRQRALAILEAATPGDAPGH